MSNEKYKKYRNLVEVIEYSRRMNKGIRFFRWQSISHWKSKQSGKNSLPMNLIFSMPPKKM